MAALKYFVELRPEHRELHPDVHAAYPGRDADRRRVLQLRQDDCAPSDSQASNRKAGPACFIVGGNISVLKTNEDGDPLAGAHFHIVCTLPTTNAFLPATIIDGVSHASTSGGVITQNVVTDATGPDRDPGAGRHLVRHHRDPGTRRLRPRARSTSRSSRPRVASITPSSTRRNSCPAPGLSITKGVSLSADGPFAASLTTDDRDDRPLPHHDHQHRQRAADGRDPHRQQVRPRSQGLRRSRPPWPSARTSLQLHVGRCGRHDREHRHGRQRRDRT